MLSAARLNNLTAPDMKPWHIKATYQTLDQAGSVTDEGTYNEWWASPHQAKMILSGKASSETQYSTDKGDFRASPHGDPRSLLTSVENYLTRPMPNEQTIERSNYSSRAIETGTLKLYCLTQTETLSATTFCVETNEPILRIFAVPSSGTQALYNQILRFQGKTIGGDFKLMRNGKAVLTLRVEAIEPIDPSNQSAFTPGPDEVLVTIPRSVNISSGVAAGMLLHKVTPEYPIAARNGRITGTVVLEARIDKEGHVSDLKVVGGPDALQSAALNAVRQWRYRPYLLNGSPVEVMTTINVIFTLGR